MGNVAVCLVGELPGSISLTADALRSRLLDHWGADAFVVARTEPGVEFDKEREERQLRLQLGPRTMSLDLKEGTELESPRETQQMSMLNGRADCLTAIRQHEVRRGAKYDVFVRMRLDAMLFEEMPRGLVSMIAAKAPCTAVVPMGEDWNGLNERMLIGDRCAYEADAEIAKFVGASGDRNKWDLEKMHELKCVLCRSSRHATSKSC